MQANCGNERLFLCLFVCGLWGPVPAFAAGVAIKNVEVDGRVQSLPGEPAAAGRDQKPLQVPSTARSLRFQFAAGDATEPPAVRLRYKLEGYDEAWREPSPRMRVLVLFSAEGVGLLAARSSTWKVKRRNGAANSKTPCSCRVRGRLWFRREPPQPASRSCLTAAKRAWA